MPAVSFAQATMHHNATLVGAAGWSKVAPGNIRIIDRCKHHFKLAQGIHVAPEPIEAWLQDASAETASFSVRSAMRCASGKGFAREPVDLANLCVGLQLHAGMFICTLSSGHSGSFCGSYLLSCRYLRP